ncbi:unnamed protein product, partial [marine sediment metagenome]
AIPANNTQPAASPSNPSVRLTLLGVATIIAIIKGIYIHPMLRVRELKGISRYLLNPG